MDFFRVCLTNHRRDSRPGETYSSTNRKAWWLSISAVGSMCSVQALFPARNRRRASEEVTQRPSSQINPVGQVQPKARHERRGGCSSPSAVSWASNTDPRSSLPICIYNTSTRYTRYSRGFKVVLMYHRCFFRCTRYEKIISPSD